MNYKYKLIDTQNKFYIVRHVFPDRDVAENEFQYAILFKTENKTSNARELLNFIASSDDEAKEMALQYAKDSKLI